MMITCTLEEDLPADVVPVVVPAGEGQTKGNAVCSHCGSEADIWLDT